VSFQSITCTGTDNLTRTTKRQNTQITQNNITQKVAVVNGTTHTQNKPRPRDRTDRDWFSRPLRYPARKCSGSILLTPEPAWSTWMDKFNIYTPSWNFFKPSVAWQDLWWLLD